ncbi:lipopolysaccharide biosynthesis protein [Pannonibacter tanglangensis]|uniref:Membrane protein involved in the export of O-antigen and teichoic acid n=1 Tax=Pannonibacter tanglangensis TaxID=2750084 RepID=A0ABW9ZHQ3_9HYPH|nr:hypothetical protein [Pannonibacter sp. XCT-34]NBN63969.1 hypothetical protein [Pannonibacter sp. XCT-34]
MSHLIGHSLLNLAASLASMLSGFLVAVLLARVLGPEGLGATAFAIWFAAAAAAVADRGWPQTLLRFVAAAAPDARAGLIRAFVRRWAVGVLLATLAGVAVAAGVALLRTPGEGAYVLLLVAICLVYSAAGLAANARRAAGDFAAPAGRTILAALLYVPAAWAGAVMAGLVGAVAALLLRSLPLLPLLGRALREPDGRNHPLPVVPQDARVFARQVWGSDLIDILVLSRLEYLFFILLASASDLGLFAVAIAFAGLVEQLSLQFGAPLVVAFAGHADSAPQPVPSAPPQLQALFERSYLALAAVCLPVCLGGAAVMPVLLPLVYGPSYAGLAPAAAALLLAAALAALAVVPWSALSALGLGRRLLGCVLALALATVMLLPAGIAAYGVAGAVAAKCAVQAAGLVLLQQVLVRAGGPRAPWPGLVRLLLAALCPALVAWLVLQVTDWPDAVALVAAVLLAVLIYPLALRLTGALPAARFGGLVEAVAASDRLPLRLRGVVRQIGRFVLVGEKRRM